MVVIQRVATLQQFILAGHDVSITYSYSAQSGKLKAKVKVSALPGIIPMEARCMLLTSLEPITALTSQYATVNRGHTFSAGHAFANFWMTPRELMRIATPIPSLSVNAPVVVSSDADATEQLNLVFERGANLETSAIRQGACGCCCLRRGS